MVLPVNPGPGARAHRNSLERSTRQKRALASALRGSDGFRSAQELFAELRDRGEDVGLTTVYNQLRALAEAGAIDVMRGDDGETRYRLCDTEHHHHHLVCRHCGRTVEVEGPEVERWVAQIAADYGYVDVTHTFDIVGTCTEGCRNNDLVNSPRRQSSC